MKKLILLLFLIPYGLAWAGSLDPEQQFDFLLGEHDVTLHAWTGNSWTPPRPVSATWNGRRGLDDAAIYDEWFDPQSGKGVNVRVYDKSEAVWKMMWISTPAYQVLDLRAEMRDGVLTMWQVYPEGSNIYSEFTMLGPCQWARESFKTDEQGNSAPQFRLVATRRNCDDKDG